jgi:hypothetical protein
MIERRTGASEWLCHPGYTQAIKANAIAVAKNIEPDIVCSREQRLAQQWMTENTLRQFGIESDSPVSAIPNADQLQNPEPLNLFKKPVLEILGMPGSGKDTIIEFLRQLHDPRICCTNEPFTALKKWNKFPKNPSPADIGLYKLAAEIAEFISGVKKGQNETKTVTVLNRSFTDDLAWIGAQFLSGKWSYVDFRERLYALEGLDGGPLARVIFMINPETTIKRKEPGQYINPEFLRVLYQQYLRLIADLTQLKPPNLVILDMSGTPEESTQKFVSVFTAITGIDIRAKTGGR